MTKVPGKGTVRNRINKEFSKSIASYEAEIPMDKICDIVKEHEHKVVDEAGEEWSGIFCGETGQMKAEITGHYSYWLHLSWYKMPHSGNYEIVVYVS